MGLPLAYGLSKLPLVLALTALAALCALSVAVAHVAEKTFNRPDPNQIVIDEIAGMTVALYALPFDLITVGVAFTLFRAIDIFKPPPVGLFEKLPGGLGVVADDIAAGIMTNLGIRLADLIAAGFGVKLFAWLIA